MIHELARFFLEGICGLTGHGLFLASSLGRRKPPKGLDHRATSIGLLFWLIVAGVLDLYMR